MENIRIRFITGFGPIVSDITASCKLYADTLGIRFKQESDGYLHTESLNGAKTFALWPLSQAAQSCFGQGSWPADIPVPQAWLEFDVEDIQQATHDVESAGYRLLVRTRREPWGQTVSRFLSPEGLLIGIAVTPALRKQ